jgi:hypothetical protein
MAKPKKKPAAGKARAKAASPASKTRKWAKAPKKAAAKRAKAAHRASRLIPFTRARALDLLRALGAKDAEGLATAEEGGFPAIARWLFLTGMWSTVAVDDSRWPGKWANPGAPIPAAIRRMLDRGIDPQDLTDVVRNAQIEALYNVAQLLEHCGHGIEEQQEKIAENVEWRLVEYDGDTGEVKRVIGALHEGFFEMDPTDRGGEPRPR